jgi:hypothetical protein
MNSFFWSQHIKNGIPVLIFSVYHWFQLCLDMPLANFKHTKQQNNTTASGVHVCLMSPVTSIVNPTRKYSRNILHMAWNSTAKCIFAESLSNIWRPTLTLIFPSRLLRTSSPIWSTSLHHKNKIALPTQCIESTSDVLFPGISLISGAVPIRFYL